MSFNKSGNATKLFFFTSNSTAGNLLKKKEICNTGKTVNDPH